MMVLIVVRSNNLVDFAEILDPSVSANMAFAIVRKSPLMHTQAGFFIGKTARVRSQTVA